LSGKERVLSQTEAKGYYDRFGEKQDSQGFYEDPALEDLIAHAAFHSAKSVFEFGCGTGKFAARLLEKHLPSSSSYLSCDVSPVMVSIAKQRLKQYGEQVKVVLSDGAVQFPLPDHSVDRVVSCYVLDLLSGEDIRCFFSESHRVLISGGKVCVASLTKGVNLLSRFVSSFWMAVFRIRPSIVGGCRPIRLEPYVDIEQWQMEHQHILTPFGVPSEVLVLIARDVPNHADAALARSL